MREQQRDRRLHYIVRNNELFTSKGHARIKARKENQLPGSLEHLFWRMIVAVLRLGPTSEVVLELFMKEKREMSWGALSEYNYLKGETAGTH